VPGYESFGGMWECPYIVNISGRDVLIFSPQYTKLPGRAESTNHNVYLIGAMDYDTLTFTPEGGYRFLDFGFDFYAAQGAASIGDPDKAVLIAWIGLPDNHYPTEEEDWEGSMTLPRELRIRDGKLIQTPIAGIEALREEEITPEGRLLPACELEIAVPEGDFDLNLFTRAEGSGGVTMHYDAGKRVCTFDRRGMEKRFNEAVGEVLDLPLDEPLRSLRIFIDRSSCEYFVNGGAATFTTHCYPTGGEFGYTVTEGANIRIWRLGRSVGDEFVI
jgi:beta-fructofuranosidase